VKHFHKLAKPRGFINHRGNLYIKPDVIRINGGAPEDILFISDIHLRRSHPESIERIREACTGLKPGLVLLGGDIAEYSEGFEAALSALRDMFGDTPIYAVPGNNDVFPEGADRQAQQKLAEKYGIHLLLNERVRHNSIELVGVEDIYNHTPDCTGLFTDEPGLYRVLLSHAPLSYLLEQASPAPDLMLSGHTHGGQLNVLGFTCYTIGYEKWLDFTHISGVKRIGKTLSIVSRGIGVSKYPLRLGAKPEIHLIGRD